MPPYCSGMTKPNRPNSLSSAMNSAGNSPCLSQFTKSLACDSSIWPSEAITDSRISFSSLLMLGKGKSNSSLISPMHRRRMKLVDSLIVLLRGPAGALTRAPHAFSLCSIFGIADTGCESPPPAGLLRAISQLCWYNASPGMSKPVPVDWPESETPLRDAWHVACLSTALGERPMHRSIVGQPIVLYRTPDGPRAFVDRCPHRGVPLSGGHCDRHGNLQCPYHGWRFDSSGRVIEIPGRVTADERTHGLSRLPLREESGLVFVCPRPGGEPRLAPYVPPALGVPGYTSVLREVVAPGSLYATAENALDVPHTSVLHRGLFRTSTKRSRIVAQVRRRKHWVETEYQGEPPPRGLVARLLAVGKDTTRPAVQHWDRFYLPGIAEVEYRLGPRSHFVVSAYLTPEAPDVTRLYAVASFRTPLPGRLLALVLEPFARMIFRQDQRILATQSEHMRRFGPAHFTSTELDTMGPHIRRLMKTAYEAERMEPGAQVDDDGAQIALSGADPTPPVFETSIELDA